jgi:hypothetical protein
MLTHANPFFLQVEVPQHDLATGQIMQMFDIKGGAKVRGGFNITRIVRSLRQCALQQPLR